MLLGSVCVPLGMAVVEFWVGSGWGATLLSSASFSCCFCCFFPSFFRLWIRSLAAADVILRTSSEMRRRSQFFSAVVSERGISTTVVDMVTMY